MKRKKNSTQPKKILILAANPIGTDRLRLDEEVRDIQEGLQRSKYREQFQVEQTWAVRLRDLRRTLLDHEPQILHFTGHGDSEGLLVEDKHGFATLVPPNSLIELFKLLARRIECVILSACYSDLQASAINKHIKYVIGMPQQIKDKAALEFSVGFYDALGAGKSVDEAHAFGCNAIQQFCPEIPDFLYPKLLVNAKLRQPKKLYQSHPYITMFFFLATLLMSIKWFSPTHNTMNIASSEKKTETVPKTLAMQSTPYSSPKTQKDQNNNYNSLFWKSNTTNTSPYTHKSTPLDFESAPKLKQDILPQSALAEDNSVYVTSSGKKYHRSSCKYLKKSIIRKTLNDAKREGFSPCSVCKPPK